MFTKSQPKQFSANMLLPKHRFIVMGALEDLTASAPSYCLSKFALNGATIMLSQALHSKGIVVNSIDPGWVRTDMGGVNASRSPEQGADTAIWLATEAQRNETGKFWRDRKVISY